MENKTENIAQGIYGPQGWSLRDETLRQLLEEKARTIPEQYKQDLEPDKLPSFMSFELNNEEAKIVLKRLIEVAPKNLDDRQNNAPSAKSLLTLAEQLDAPVTLEAYYVGGGRLDERISIEGIRIDYKAIKTAEQICNLIPIIVPIIADMGQPDSVTHSENTIRLWWD